MNELLKRISKYRQRRIGRYRRGTEDFNYVKALGLARHGEIITLVKRDIANFEQKQLHVRTCTNNMDKMSWIELDDGTMVRAKNGKPIYNGKRKHNNKD